MSVGFGFSLGIFLAALRPAGTVFDVLCGPLMLTPPSARWSTSFKNWNQCCYALNTIGLDDRHSVGKLALRQAASQCQRTIVDTFRKEIQKHQPHLQQNGADSRMRDRQSLGKNQVVFVNVEFA
jgi:hypothetical protein